MRSIRRSSGAPRSLRAGAGQQRLDRGAGLLARASIAWRLAQRLDAPPDVLRDCCRSGGGSLVHRLGLRGTQQVVEHALHFGAGPVERRLEGLRGQAQHLRDQRALLRIGGQAVRLSVLAELDRMLGAPQQHVGLCQGTGIRLRENAAFGQRSQGGQGAAVPQAGVASATHHLEQLGGELDLPDAAAAQRRRCCRVALRRGPRRGSARGARAARRRRGNRGSDGRRRG